MVNLQTGEGLARLVLLLDLVGNLFLEVGGLILVARVLQHTVLEQRVVKIVGIGLAEEGAVQIEHGHAIHHGDIAVAVLVGDGGHEGLQLLLGAGVRRPRAQKLGVDLEIVEALQRSRGVSLRNRAAGIQTAPLRLQHVGAQRPLESGSRPVGVLKGVVIAEDVGVLPHGDVHAQILRVTVEDGRQLLAGDGALRQERTVADAAHQPGRRRPADRLSIGSVLRNVPVAQRVVDHRLAFPLPERGTERLTGQCRGRAGIQRCLCRSQSKAQRKGQRQNQTADFFHSCVLLSILSRGASFDIQEVCQACQTFCVKNTLFF